MSVFPVWGVTPDITDQDYDDVADAGILQRAARADHRHGMPAASGGGGGGGEAFPVGSVFLSVVATDPATLLGYGTWAAIGAGRVLVGIDAGDTDFDTVEETGGAKVRTPSAHAGATVADHAALSHSAHAGATVADHASHTHTYTDVVTHTHATDSQGAHTHTQAVNTATTGGLSGYTPDTSTNTSATSGYSTGSNGAHTHTANAPAGAVATGTTAGPSATLGHTVGQANAHSDHAAQSHTVGQANAHSDHAAQSHTVGQASDHAAMSVVQPYLVVHMWKRTA